MRDQLLLYRQRLLERFHALNDDIEQELRRIAPGRWQIAASDGNSPHYILARLRAIEARAFSIRIQRILDEQEPYLPLFDENQWMDEHYDPLEPPEGILVEYISLRNHEFALLKNLSPQDWNRTGRHPWWGMKALQWWVEQILRFSEEQLQHLRAINRA